MEDEEEKGRRVRVSLTPSMQRRVGELVGALGVSEPAVISFALAMGLRFLDASLANPQGVMAVATQVAGLPVRD
jgi:hypothetical protein